MALAAAGMALALGVIVLYLPTRPTWLAGLIGIIVGGLVYFGLAYVLGVDELRVVLRKSTRRFGIRY